MSRISVRLGCLCSTLVYHPMISRSTKYRWIFNHFSRSTISRCIFNHISRSTRTIYQCFFNHISRSTIYRCIFNHISRSTIYRCIFNHISRSTLNQWLFNTFAISPSKPNINAYSIIKITIVQCCSNVVAININNIRFHRYGNGDSTFILHWNFNINHNDDSDGKSMFIQCLLAVWGTSPIL